jgi:TolB-like protein/DNA-binding winged helix-turn-helix (wHTH) protein
VTESGATQGWIVFDAVEIDIAGRRLLVENREVLLEPKAFAVLQLLASQPGRAFARDDILDAVWGHRHVTPGVLNRIITLLRHALGESAEEHRYLRTLHAVGYRFDAQVRRLDAQPGMSEQTTIASAERGSTAANNLDQDGNHAATTKSEPVSVTDSGARTDAVVLAPPQALDPPPAAARSRRWLGLAALLATAIIALGMFWLLRKPALPSGAVPATPALVVLPLRPLGGEPGDNVLAEGLSEELITHLAHIEGLRLISRTSAQRAQEAKFDLAQLSERLHVTHALEGSLRQSGDQLRIDLRLIELPGGRMLWAQDYDRKVADVFAIQREVAQAVAQALTLKLGLANTATDAGIDPQWFRDYLELRRQMWDRKNLFSHAEFVERSRALVGRAPAYARAHGLLARALIQDLRPVAISADERSEAAKEAARALELDPNQIDAHAALASVACRAHEWPRCMEEYRHALSLDPTDSVLRASYAAWLAAIGYLDEALHQVEIGAASDPLNFESGVLRGWLLDLMGRHEEAKHWFDAGVLRGTALPWFNAVWRHDFVAARELAANVEEKDKGDSYVAASEALIDPARWPQVQARIEGSLVYLLQPDADGQTSMRMVEELWAKRVSPLGLVLWSPDFASLHRHPAFQDFLRRNHIIDYWRSNAWPPQCKPEGDGARCD